MREIMLALRLLFLSSSSKTGLTQKTLFCPITPGTALKQEYLVRMVTSADSITVKVLFFARARELTNQKEIVLTIPPQTAHTTFTSTILPKFPALEPLASHCVLAVNQAYLEQDQLLRDGDELAVIPPISGG